MNDEPEKVSIDWDLLRDVQKKTTGRNVHTANGLVLKYYSMIKVYNTTDNPQRKAASRKKIDELTIKIRQFREGQNVSIPD